MDIVFCNLRLALTINVCVKGRDESALLVPLRHAHKAVHARTNTFCADLDEELKQYSRSLQ